MTARWIPDDNELDALARGRDAFVPSPERAEQNRTALLASAAGRRQQSRRSIVPYAIVGAAMAAAARSRCGSRCGRAMTWSRRCPGR